MSKFIKFGEDVEGYNIPVLNEREVRASAGILFLFLLISIFLILSNGNFAPIKYFIIIFLADFIVRVFVNPRFSPTLIIGRMIVRNQNPEYVGAQQKKFAWIIGLVLAAIMFVLFIIINAYSIITALICLICLVFLFFESAFGICLGCLFYGWIYKEKAQYCPGEICDVKNRQDIQKISKIQIFVIFGFIIYLFFAVILLDDNFSEKPSNLWDKFDSELHE